MDSAGVARRLDAGARALEAALVAPMGAHPLPYAASCCLSTALCSQLLPTVACTVSNPRILPSPPLATSIGEAPFLCGNSNRCLGALPAWCPSAPRNSSPARHTLQQRACRSARCHVALLLMTLCGVRTAAGACGRGGLAEEAHHLVGLLEAAAHGEVRHGHAQRLLRDGVPGGGALRCHSRWPQTLNPSLTAASSWRIPGASRSTQYSGPHRCACNRAQQQFTLSSGLRP